MGGDIVLIGPNAYPILLSAAIVGTFMWCLDRWSKKLPLLPPWMMFWDRQSDSTTGDPVLHRYNYPPQEPVVQEPAPAPETLTLVAPLRSWWPKVIEHDAHIMLVGETRSGKSTTARALLAARAHTDKIVVIDPHMKFNDWGSVGAIGDGRDFAAITQAFLTLHKEFERRFKIGEAVGEPLTVFIDEFPAISAARPDLTGYLTQWLRESAKAKIRLILLVQDANVETLGIKGEGPVRENLLKILLGSFAVKKGATGSFPAALDRRGEITLVSTDGITAYAQMAVSAQATWPIEITKDDEDSARNMEHWHDLLRVAQLLERNPDISQREIAQNLWPNKNPGGRSAMKAKTLLDEVQILLRVPGDGPKSVPQPGNTTNENAEHFFVEQEH
jgi:ABC-type dipeptide/oligopeptide/nickel transport system ATPase subunit